MPPEEKSNHDSMRQQAGILFKPKNLLKTIAAQFPIASIATDMMDQIEGHETDLRIESLEAEVKSLAKLHEMEDAAPKTPAPIHDWSIPTSEFLRRTVHLAVAYDGGFHSPERRGRELLQPIAHACIIGEREILTCKEAMDLARYAAEHKNGRIIILAGMARYDFNADPVNELSGLCVCRLTKRDEEEWREAVRSWKKHGLGELEHDLVAAPVRHSVSPWMGQEVGFIHSGEAQDVLRGRSEFAKLQFDAGTISHFRRPKRDAFKVFVTGILGGRILQTGSAVFSRDGTLLGILSDTEHYQSDAGRRAVVRGLLGHPRFTKFKKKEGKDAPS